jgi:ABC-type iron transport system FetAB ATPase subunit
MSPLASHLDPDPHTPRARVFEVRNLTRSLGDSLIHSGISFTVRSGEALFIRGPSGVGKTLLLRSLAFLDPFDSGRLTLDGQSPEQLGVPTWRARVCYVFQQRIAFAGTPSELYFAAQQFGAQRGRPRGDLPALVHDLGLEQSVLNQPWAELSVRRRLKPAAAAAAAARRPPKTLMFPLLCCGTLVRVRDLQGGQAQRVQLAIAVALNPAVLLLDEPTSSLDVESARRVERVLKACGAALIWVSHDPHQPARVGGRCLHLPAGIESSVLTPPASPDAAKPPSLPRGSRAPSLEHLASHGNPQLEAPGGSDEHV